MDDLRLALVIFLGLCIALVTLLIVRHDIQQQEERRPIRHLEPGHNGLPHTLDSDGEPLTDNSPLEGGFG
jgi:hypothetical protein